MLKIIKTTASKMNACSSQILLKLKSMLKNKTIAQICNRICATDTKGINLKLKHNKRDAVTVAMSSITICNPPKQKYRWRQMVTT